MHLRMKIRRNVPREGNNPDNDVLGIIARLRKIAADATFNEADRSEARRRARQLSATMRRARRPKAQSKKPGGWGSTDGLRTNRSNTSLTAQPRDRNRVLRDTRRIIVVRANGVRTTQAKSACTSRRRCFWKRWLGKHAWTIPFELEHDAAGAPAGGTKPFRPTKHGAFFEEGRGSASRAHVLSSGR